MAKTAEQQFAEMDTDNDGFITVDELRESLENNPKVTEEHIAQTMAVYDNDGDKKITLEEYASLAR